MVGNNDIESYPACLLHLRQAGNAAVNSDDQADALLLEVLEGSLFQSVAFGQAVWDIGDNLATKS